MNATVTLLRHARTESGWRRCPVILTKNGKLKHQYMLVGGKEVFAPHGSYVLRTYSGRLPVYNAVGDDPTDALAQLHAEENKLAAKSAAEKAGLEVSEKDRGKTLKQYAKAYIEKHRDLPHRSDDSLAVYTRITANFLLQCKATYPADVTESDVIRWHGWMRKEMKYSDRTCSNYYRSLRGFLRYCGVKPSALIDKGTHQLLQKYTKKTVNTYTPEVVKKLIQHSSDANDALLWDFLYKTGLRDSEVQAITRHDLHDLDTDNPTVHVREKAGYGQIKDSEERIVELHPSLVSQIKAWLKYEPKKLLLFGTRNDKPNVRMLFALKNTARRAGLNCGHCKGCLGKNNECGEFTLHRFRRTYTTRMLKATGGDLRSVMARTGHSDLKSVMRYLEPDAHIRTALTTAF